MVFSPSNTLWVIIKFLFLASFFIYHGVWVGGEDRSIHFEDIAFGQGASMALPIWALYMRDVYKNQNLGISQEDFEEPKKVSIPTDCDKFDSNKLNIIGADEDLEDLGF